MYFDRFGIIVKKKKDDFVFFIKKRVLEIFLCYFLKYFFIKFLLLKE